MRTHDWKKDEAWRKRVEEAMRQTKGYWDEPPPWLIESVRRDPGLPSGRQILFALLRFGAASPDGKAQVMEAYLEISRGRGGGPHVWNPDVEVVESLWKYPCRCAESEAETAIGTEIERIADNLLENQPALVDRTAFAAPLGLELQATCGKLLALCGPEKEEPLSFWDLMCYTCD
jgi:hypothetical protein